MRGVVDAAEEARLVVGREWTQDKYVPLVQIIEIEDQ